MHSRDGWLDTLCTCLNKCASYGKHCATPKKVEEMQKFDWIVSGCMMVGETSNLACLPITQKLIALYIRALCDVMPYNKLHVS
jgi:hypothetical protein